jgi:hypothetical protein
MLTNLVNTGMKKWNPSVHHPFGLMHWWVLVQSGWYRGGLYRKASPLYWVASLIMPNKWYGIKALHPWPHGPPVVKGCNALLLGLSPTTHRNLWIKFHKMTNYFMFYFMLYFNFTLGGSSSKSWHTMFWVRMNFTIRDAIEYKVFNWREDKSEKRAKTVWSLNLKPHNSSM